MSYFGNKRDEVEIIFSHINLNGVKIIVEPFCGSCAMSYYISTQKKKLKYILNDNNPFLIELINIARDDKRAEKFEQAFNILVKSFKDNKDKYDEIVKQKNIMGWYIANKIHGPRVGLFPLKNYNDTIKLSDCPFYNFLKNEDVEIYNKEAIEIYNEYKDNKNCMILLDPPYLETCNDFYNCADVNIYKFLYDNPIEKEKAKIYLILEDMWIIKLLFQKNTFIEYDKQYNGFKKKLVKHCIINNKK